MTQVQRPEEPMKRVGVVRSVSVPESGTESATRVADILLLFNEKEEWGVTEIARATDLSKSVVHRILQALESRQILCGSGHPRRYQFGSNGFMLAARALNHFDLRVHAEPVLRALSLLTRETTTLSALYGTSRVYLDQICGSAELSSRVVLGRPFSLHAGASSLAILAHVDEQTLSLVLANTRETVTPETITDADEILRVLKKVRVDGFATSIGERIQGAGSIAAPVFGPLTNVLGSISICGPSTRFANYEIDRMAQAISLGAAEVTRRIAEVNHREVGNEFRPEPIEVAQ